ncbi:helix-turn-helix transcriptional regulator [Cellulomonas xylanilytica]|uniref:helix-turn-helix transcriptional regulator n=1 Tax=Cellulomonas xylanilytica TaxID=233583 RepID=UPI0011BE1470|nr:LuxR C-terminal-related transcriptional regulator [Cellulomonas xylanilytica]
MKLADALRIGVDSARQVAAGLDYAQELADRVNLAFGADAGAGFCEWSTVGTYRTRALVLASSRPPPWTDTQMATAEAMTARHPSMTGLLRGSVVQRVSDVTDLPRFWESDVYAAMHAPLEARYPAAVVLHRTHSTLTFLAVQRQVRDLDDDELTCLDALGAPLRAAFDFRTALDAAVERLGEAPEMPNGPFTRREAEVIVMVARGWTTTRISRRLGIGESAVKHRLVSARDRVGAATRAELVARWAQGGRPVS